MKEIFYLVFEHLIEISIYVAVVVWAYSFPRSLIKYKIEEDYEPVTGKYILLSCLLSLAISTAVATVLFFINTHGDHAHQGHYVYGITAFLLLFLPSVFGIIKLAYMENDD